MNFGCLMVCLYEFWLYDDLFVLILVVLVLSIVIPIFMGKGDIRKYIYIYICYRSVKLLVHGMKVVERVLLKWPCRLVTVDEMKCNSALYSREERLMLCYFVKAARTVSS